MTSFRVECNRGSKYFKNGIDAFKYFHAQALKGFAVEIYLRQVTVTRKIFSVKEELLDYNIELQGLVRCIDK